MKQEKSTEQIQHETEQMIRKITNILTIVLYIGLIIYVIFSDMSSTMKIVALIAFSLAFCTSLFEMKSNPGKGIKNKIKEYLDLFKKI